MIGDGRPRALRIDPGAMAASGLCTGCGSCVSGAAGSGVTMDLDRFGQYRPPLSLGGDWTRIELERFARTCPFSPAADDEDRIADRLFPEAPHRHPASGRFLSAWVGAVEVDDFRPRGSSGGMVTWVLTELLRTGRIDGAAHVVATDDPRRDGRFFRYRISRTEEEIRAGAKSRYYPVELSGVLDTIRTIPGRYAVVGVPCFIKAVQLLRSEDPVFSERIAYTLGLFCGHMKSARFVESLAWQMGVEIGDITAVEFRLKDPARPASTYTAQLTLHDGREVRRDWWNLVDGDWGAGYFQDPGCNFCDDVVAETADISFGDAWVEPYTSDGRGTNVVIVRSPELERLVRSGIGDGRLALRSVDGEFVGRTQAAGLRQRREGLAYRLALKRRGLRAVKRIEPITRAPNLRRRMVYRSRARITFWSHRVFHLARMLRRPGLYLRWAGAALAVYQGITYSRGRVGAFLDAIRLRAP